MEGFIPVESIQQLQDVLQMASVNSGGPRAILEIAPSNPHKRPLAPPTAFSLHRMMQPYQDLVSTYGVPRYQEINPGIFTVVTFPFLFGVMVLSSSSLML